MSRASCWSAVSVGLPEAWASSPVGQRQAATTAARFMARLVEARDVGIHSLRSLMTGVRSTTNIRGVRLERKIHRADVSRLVVAPATPGSAHGMAGLTVSPGSLDHSSDP